MAFSSSTESSKRIPHAGFSRIDTLLTAIGVLAFSLWSCRLAPSDVQDVADFDRMYDQLSQYDSVVIVFADGDGNFLDTAFQGKVDNPGEISRIGVNGWHGGDARITISGFMGETLVFQQQRIFDGAADKVDSIRVVRVPETSLSSEVDNLLMREGDSLPLPVVTVTPATLVDKSLSWDVSDSDIVVERAGRLRARAPGSASLTATLQSDPSVRISIQVLVKAFGSGTPVVVIESPVDSAVTRFSPIKVVWAVDGIPQDTLPLETLVEGRNILARSVKDGDGNEYGAKVTVFYDKTPPAAPSVHGSVVISTASPTWTWASNGGGAGIFRYGLDGETFTAPETHDTSFTPASPLLEGAHTLFVQERDLAGNWSASGKLAITLELTPPGAPKVKVSPAGSTNNPKPTWTWSGTGGATGFQYRLDSSEFSGQSLPAQDTSFSPDEDLPEGVHTLYVRERNAAGAWSPVGSASVIVDVTPPDAPVLSGASPTNADPKWTWRSGNGGNDIFRYRLDDSLFTAADIGGSATSYEFANPVTGTAYTLFVQERDAAGNWSPTASGTIVYDVTRPVVAIAAPQASGTFYTSAGVALSGTATGPLPITKVTYRIGTGNPVNAAFTAPDWTIATLVPPEGTLTQITISAVDNAGNTGEASLGLFLDATPPLAPVLTTGPAAAINLLKVSFAWNPGSDGATGSGLNGRYRYNLNGGAWKDTTEALLVDLPLVPGSNTFSVQEQDKAQLWSASASRTVVVDTASPGISLASPASNPFNSSGLTITLTGQVKDSGTGVASMAVSGMTAGSPTITVTGTSWSTSVLTLVSGANMLTVTAVDQVGNSRSLPVRIDVSLPAAVVAVTSPADSLTVTRLDTIRAFYTIDGVAGNKLFNMAADGVYRFEIVSPPNASGNIGRDTVKVTRDATAPNAPNLTAGATPTNGSATWSWASSGDNAGGAGLHSPHTYRYSLDNGSSWTETTTPNYSIGTEGSHTLIVQEEDKAGNWSASTAAKAVVVDKTAPMVAITYPDPDFPNYATNKSSLTVRYKVDNGTEQSFPCALNANASKLCIPTASDAAGNVGSDTVTVWSRPNVTFFTPNGAGNMDGTDWENAMSDAQMKVFLSPPIDQVPKSVQELWLSNGNFIEPKENYIDASFITGFDAASRPYNTANRNLTGTRLEVFAGYNDGEIFRLDGGVTNGIGSYRCTVTLTDVTIKPTQSAGQPYAISAPDGAVYTLNNVQIVAGFFSNGLINMGGDLTINGGFAGSNSYDSFQYLIDVWSTGIVKFNYPFAIGNEPKPWVHVQSGGKVEIQKNVGFKCSDSEVKLENGANCIDNVP